MMETEVTYNFADKYDNLFAKLIRTEGVSDKNCLCGEQAYEAMIQFAENYARLHELGRAARKLVQSNLFTDFQAMKDIAQQCGDLLDLRLEVEI